MPSGPGWFWARVRTMKAWLGGTSSPVPALPSGPSVISGSSAFSGTNTVPPLLTVWSTPWSKNWPKNVNSELYGGERPTSVVTFGMNRVWCDGHATGGDAGDRIRKRRRVGSVVHGMQAGVALGAHRERRRRRSRPGSSTVWSTIRFEITRGCESTTLPVFCAYDVGPGGPTGRPT